MSAAPAPSALGQALEKAIWELHQLEKIIELGAPSDERVIEKIEDFAQTLPALREAAEKCDDVEIPVELLRDVDQGKKPMGFMINQILAAGTVNETVKGKANVYREFAEALKGKLDGGEKKAGAKRGKK
ncbi:predicted protein [Ostreococcus lucimarinus CCE9901]|uniref:Mediator of RNA polymerase II transcription subunit 10 n=1 Tax=Ostreococcus lucimarinus (strain CCE9901) TaxID=436017 RepID=A4S1I9_OSTLU|nr:predicted protein [Ostreococcus lucimarinus CCE9901]ABO97668.1 predicted protein [Ostreococcus lucimarinus CCE9901]|eukprot:XP_001419375.1 predicted protein [Ostreococcus lucimarinus CCE9901]